jgi:uncharacterized membrane protein SpoIIM required for sporulation/uncharacterized RDD family membrane protein YckC
MMFTTPDLVADSVTGVEVVLPIAGPGARSFAFLIDWFIRAILSVAWFVVSALVHNARWSLAQPLIPDAAWFIFVLTPTAAIFLLYHPVLEISMRGRTPGKRFAGVRIVTRTGGSPGVAALLTRNAFRIIDSFPLVYGVGLLVTMISREHLRIGDFAAGTVLVYERQMAPLPDPRATGLGRAPQWASRSAQWTTATARARLLAESRVADISAAAQLADDYRLLAHDLAEARRLMPGTALHEYLELAYAQTHATLHKPGWSLGHDLLTLFSTELPQIVRRLRPYILWSTALFLLAIAAGYLLVRAYPGLIALFASPELIASVRKGQLWTDGLLNVVPSSVLSLQILANNVVVSLVAWCAGFLFGLGTFYILGLNGMMLGAVFAFSGLHGLGGSLFRFIVPHGPVEISVMCLSGAAGAAVGEALIRPARGTRAESFRAAAAESGKLLSACLLLLVGSGLIEGYVSPNPDVPLWARVAIGVAYWLLMIALLRGWLVAPLRLAPLRLAPLRFPPITP